RRLTLIIGVAMPKKKCLVLGPDTRKCQPRLRMIANGSVKVNTVRAEQCASIAVNSQALLKQVPEQRGKDAVPLRKAQLQKSVKPKKQKSVTGNVFANVFIETLDASSHKRRFAGE